ncbi:MAG: hypothetical protein JKY89_06020 [Immundisolibacteraceae bacterium]|nr:hypothetical protein [Immundisolibacteraceae bacterium]
MLEVAIVFAAQLALVFLKHLNIRKIAGQKVAHAVCITGAIQAVWLVASALGIKGFLDGDYTIVAAYIIGGMVGSYLQFKLRV